MPTTLVDVAGLQAEFSTLDPNLVARIADEVVAEASLYAPQLLVDGYVVPAGIKAILTRATRGQLASKVEQGTGSAVTGLTAGGLQIRFKPDGTSLYGNIFTDAQIAALRASGGNPQAALGSMTVW